ncbi:MAG: HAD family phosphatase [Caulobacteraceae bacterium]|nr:HAD family phosphatase [Caulobacteraceae bacterium]
MKHLVLDIGGVFYLGKTDKAFWRAWAQRAGLAPDDLESGFWYGPDIEAANIGDIDRAEYCRRTALRIGATPQVISDVVQAAFNSEFNQALADHIRGLRERGAAVSALSNSWSSEAAILARPELAGLFDHAVSSADVKLTKPDPAIYRLALQRLGVSPRDVVFIDDTPGLVEAARRLGIGAIHFRDTAQVLAELAVVWP